MNYVPRDTRVYTDTPERRASRAVVLACVIAVYLMIIIPSGVAVMRAGRMMGWW